MNTHEQIADSLHSAHAIIALIIDHLSAHEDLPAHRVATSHRALVVASQSLDAVWEAIIAGEESA